MDFKLSAQLSKILILSKEEADKRQQPFVGTSHILLGMLRHETHLREMLQKMNVDITRLEQETADKLSTESNQEQTLLTTLSLNEDATRILRIGCLEARLYKDDTVKTEHLLLAMLRDNDNVARQLLRAHEVTYPKVAEALHLNTRVSAAFNFDEEYSQPDDGFPNNKESHAQAHTAEEKKSKDTPILNSLGTDLTQAATKFDPTIGRETEISRVSQILCRRKKNNPILIGEPGVGKSAIVEGLATAIHNHTICWPLQTKRIIALDMGALLAGTKYRGQFEERIQGIIQEAKNNPDIILFIDEIHTIIGAGSSPGTIDAANMLKPALSRGEIQCIGATTINEYRKTIEKDGALERRFQKVMVEPTTAEQTLTILQNLKPRYEAYHHVSFSPEALNACVDLAARYLTERSFPDKAIDLMDEAGSKAFLEIRTPDEIVEQEKTIAGLNAQKETAAKSQNYELAANIRDQIVSEQKKLDTLKANWRDNQDSHRQIISEDDIRQIVSSVSGIPVNRIGQPENMKLKNMRQTLGSKVIGQDEAINKIVKAITRSRIGIKDPNRPIGTFLFVGSTGVGKTYLVKILAECLFGSADAIIRLDMSEYMDKYNASRLVGAPPGYVGYEEGGQLTEKVRRHPYSVILLDEIEKAHTDIYNLLLQVFDEGRLTDNYGTTVDFKNTIIIMTSNCGTRQLKEDAKGIGFTASASAARNDSIINKSLNKRFAPEFLNRLDDIVMFNPLSKDAIHTIAQNELGKLTQRLHQLHYDIQLDEQVVSFIADKGFSEQFGARPLKRAIQTYIEDKIGEYLVDHAMQQGETSLTITTDGKDTFVKATSA